MADKFLPIPGGTSQEQMLTIINRNFAELDQQAATQLFKIVGQGTMQVSSNGDALNWTNVAHGLPFIPVAMGFMNNVTMSSGSEVITSSGSLPLPVWVDLTVDGAEGVVEFNVYLQIFADAENITGFMTNATGAPVSARTITYYLLQQRASLE